MKTKPYLFVLIIVFSLIFTACQANIPFLTQNEPQRGSEIPTPAAGKATLAGRAVQADGSPYANTPLRLAQIYREGDQGAFVIDTANSPASMSNEDGYFTFIDVPPAEYLIVIGWLEDTDYTIYQNRSGEPYTYHLATDETRDLGVLRIERIP